MRKRKGIIKLNKRKETIKKAGDFVPERGILELP